jgi:DNA-binding NarL/FixJ family response regulator
LAGSTRSVFDGPWRAFLKLEIRRAGGKTMGQLNAVIVEQAVKGKGVRRSQMEVLQSRLGLLSGKDKVLMTMYITNGNSFRQIARLRGVSETSVARRIHQIAERLTDGEFLICVRNRDKLSRRQMAIARDSFLTGLSNNQIARKRSMSLYAVRKELADIRNLIREMKPVSSQC